MSLDRDKHLGEFHRRSDAAAKVLELLRSRREVPLSELADIAKEHNIEQGSLIREVEISPDCEIDLAAGVVRCPE